MVKRLDKCGRPEWKADYIERGRLHLDTGKRMQVPTHAYFTTDSEKRNIRRRGWIRDPQSIHVGKWRQEMG